MGDNGSIKHEASTWLWFHNGCIWPLSAGHDRPVFGIAPSRSPMPPHPRSTQDKTPFPSPNRRAGGGKSLREFSTLRSGMPQLGRIRQVRLLM